MAQGNRPGFFDTFRHGWTPPSKREASSAQTQTRTAPAAAAEGAPAAAAGGAKRPAKRKAAAGRGGGAKGPSKASTKLIRRKDELAKQFAELQWDLGGIAYEMARRDHYRLEVLNAQAAKLQEVDAELGQIERMIKLDEAGAAGNCPSCGALQARGASFCWHCGKELTLDGAAKPARKKKAAAKPAPPKTKPIRRGRSRGS